MPESGHPPASESEGVRETYARRLAERSRQWERWSYWDRRLADVRLAAFIGIVIGAVWLYQESRTAAVWLAVSVALFVALVVIHEPIKRRGGPRRGGRSISMPEGLARVEGRWAGTGVAGLEYLDLDHPYAADLDLFGRGSMFERLCTARTRSGEAVLASWLLEPAGSTMIAERHRAIDELRPRLDLREDLELLGAEVRAGIDPEALAAWCAAPRAFTGWALPLVAAIAGRARRRPPSSAGSSSGPGCSPC